MAMTFDHSPAGRALEALASAPPAQWIVQAAVAAAAVVLGWYLARRMCGRVAASPKWTFGKGAFERVAFPLLALALVWSAGRAMAPFQSTELLHIVVLLLAAYAVIRAGIYILGHVIPEGGVQRGVIRIVYWTVWITAILYVTGLLPEVLGFLDAHGVTFGKDKKEITLLDLPKGLGVVFLTVVIALWVSRVTEGRVLASESMEMTTRVVITKVVRVVTALVAIFIALPLAGIDITTISILTGAVGVGLGFGLQKILSNYVSGFIVLVERSLRIGDLVTVDNRKGEVTAIEMRYTVIKGADGVESIIPNEKMITESVSHHTYSDPRVSVVVTVVVAYDTDIDKALRLLEEAARRRQRALGEPPVTSRIKQLLDRGMEMELTVWIDDPALGEGDLRSDLLKDIVETFRREGISIPYQRREMITIATPETLNSAIRSTT